MTSIFERTLSNQSNDYSVGNTSGISALIHTIYESVTTQNHIERLQHLLAHQLNDELLYDRQVVRQIIRHIRRAISQGNKLSQSQSERERLLSVFDQITPAIFALNTSAELIGSNHSANELLRQQNLFSVNSSKLESCEPQLLHNVLQQCDRNGYAYGGIQDLLGNHWALYCFKNSTHTLALLCIDSTWAKQQTFHFFEHEYKLTPKELDIVGALIDNHPSQAIAKNQGITLETVRRHTKNIFQKTRVHSQNELVSLFLQQLLLEESQPKQQTEFALYVRGMTISDVVSMPSGRQVSVAQYGAPNGDPVFYFHSLNSSRLELLLLQSTLVEANVRLISVDRPGYGLTTYWEPKTYSDYCNDYLYVLDHLGIKQVNVLGFSSGCAHALALTANHPERVKQTQLTALVPEPKYIRRSVTDTFLKDLFMRLIEMSPSLRRSIFDLVFHGQTVTSLMEAFESNDSKSIQHDPRDRELIGDTQNRPYFAASIMESLRQGTKTWALEATTLNSDWDINYANILAPITLWHGHNDMLATVEMIEILAQKLPTAAVEIITNESHYLIFRHLSRILAHFKQE